MKLPRLLLAVAFGAGLLSLPATAEAEVKAPYVVVGRVTDNANRPVVNELVRVDLNGPWDYTDANGEYEIQCNCYGSGYQVILDRLWARKPVDFAAPGAYRVDFVRARYILYATPSPSYAPVQVLSLPGQVNIAASTSAPTAGLCVWAKERDTGAIRDLTLTQAGAKFSRYGATIELPVGTTAGEKYLRVAGYDCNSGIQLTWDYPSQDTARYVIDLAAPGVTVVAPAGRTNVSSPTGGVGAVGKRVFRVEASFTDDAYLSDATITLQDPDGESSACRDSVYGTADKSVCEWLTTPGTYRLTTTVRDRANRTTTDTREVVLAAV